MADARALFLDAFRWSKGQADFSGVFRSAEVLAAIGPVLAEPFRHQRVDGVIAAEARGFVIGALVARELDVGLVLARKPGSVHPDALTATATAPDWRGRHTQLRVNRNSVAPGDRLLLTDDWIETGSQAQTISELVTTLSGSVVGVSVLVDDTTAVVRQRLGVIGLVRSDELPPQS